MRPDTPLDPRYVPPTYNPADYDRPSVTVDVALFAWRDDVLHVLLCRRKAWPYKDFWALPGGFVEMGESLDDAARRELHEETGLREVYLEQLHTFGDPERDPRTRVISVAYLGLASAQRVALARAGDDAAEVRWWPAAAPPPLAFDHEHILSYALQRLRAKLEQPAVACLLLPETFSLGELQALYEAVLGELLDKRNFRRKVLATGALEETGEYRNGSLRRPARLYRFTAEAAEAVAQRR